MPTFFALWISSLLFSSLLDITVWLNTRSHFTMYSEYSVVLLNWDFMWLTLYTFKKQFLKCQPLNSRQHRWFKFIAKVQIFRICSLRSNIANKIALSSYSSCVLYSIKACCRNDKRKSFNNNVMKTILYSLLSCSTAAAAAAAGSETDLTWWLFCCYRCPVIVFSFSGFSKRYSIHVHMYNVHSYTRTHIHMFSVSYEEQRHASCDLICGNEFVCRVDSS